MRAQPSHARRRGVSAQPAVALPGGALPTVALPGGGTLRVAVRRSARARRILVTVAPVDGVVELVLPHGVPVDEGMAFAAAKAGWIAEKTARALGRVLFAEGVELPWLGARLRVRAAAGHRATAWRVGETLFVPGRPEELPGRVWRWLRASARLEIVPRVADKAARLGRPYRRVAVRDARTRWGSCSARGNLSFCWRLVLAPERVLDYVVAHEVAHLAEMNHGRRFWTHVARLCEDPAGARAWLKANGPGLHRYG